VPVLKVMNNMLLRSQSLYRKYRPNLPTSLTHRISKRSKVVNLGDLMRLSVQSVYILVIITNTQAFQG